MTARLLALEPRPALTAHVEQIAGCAWCGERRPLSALTRVSAVRRHKPQRGLFAREVEWYLLRCTACTIGSPAR